MNETFKFSGHTFEPLRSSLELGGFNEIFNNVYEKVIMSPLQPWSLFIFSGLAKTDRDIFLMDGKIQVLATEKGLYVFGKESHKAYRKYLLWFNFLTGTKGEYDKLVAGLLSAVKLHVAQQGEIGADKEFVPYTAIRKDGMVTEQVQRVFLTGDRKYLCIDTDEDNYCEETTAFSVSNLIALFEYIMKYEFRDFA